MRLAGLLLAPTRSGHAGEAEAEQGERGEFGVARAGGGYATVAVKKPDGRTRAIFFRMGRPLGADVAESECRHDFSATKQGDLYRIRIGHERYEMPDAVILGG